MKFEGIIPPVITPFNDDFSVDEPGYAAMIEYMIEKGVHAIIVGGTTGEYYALTRDERVRQFQFAKDVIGGRVPMVAGVNDARTEDAVALGVAAHDAGADGLLIAAPYYSLPAEDELISHCLEIDAAAGLPIMLYNYPGRTGVWMGETFLDEVGGHANFRCIKEASGDIDRVHLLARQYPHIELSCGAEDQALEFFVWGATSWVTPMGNFIAEEVVAFYDTCVRERDFIKARHMMSALMPLTTALERGGKFLQCTKFACAFHGLPAGPVRKPMRPMSEALEHEMRDVLQTAKAALQDILNGQGGGQSHVRLVDQA
ncbi:MAG: dihydrodipicolinate synthase family protein [Hyphomicrobiales bacterium]